MARLEKPLLIPGKINLFRIALIGFLFGFITLNAHADNIEPVEQHPKFMKNINKADAGYWAACKYVAQIYEEYEHFEESIPYWKCAMKVPYKRYNRNPSMSHLAGHYLHGVGVEKNPSKGAMYLILAERYTWSHDKRKWWHIFDIYHDISEFPDIEKDFRHGAKLAIDYLAQVDPFDPSPNEAEINRRLETHLRAIRRAKKGGFLNSISLYVLALFAVLFLIRSFAAIRPSK